MNSKDTRLHNLLFLFSAMPMATGCIIVSDDGDDETGTSGASASGSASDTDGTSGGSGTTGSGESAGETAADETAGGETGADETGAGETGESSEVCYQYGSLVTDCTMNEEYGVEARQLCSNYSDEYFDLGGAACQAAYEEFIACLNALSCEEFLSEDPVCQAESGGIDEACPVE